MSPNAVKKRIAYWQKLMGLGGWELFFSDVDAAEDSLATTNPEVMTRQACIRLLHGAPDDQVDRLLVHELTHVLLREMTDLYERGIEDRGTEAKGFMEAQWSRFEEGVCERLAFALTGVARVEFNEDAPHHWKHASLVR